MMACSTLVQAFRKEAPEMYAFYERLVSCFRNADGEKEIHLPYLHTRCIQSRHLLCCPDSIRRWFRQKPQHHMPGPVHGSKVCGLSDCGNISLWYLRDLPAAPEAILLHKAGAASAEISGAPLFVFSASPGPVRIKVRLDHNPRTDYIQ